VKERRARGEDGLTATAVMGAAATDGGAEALTDDLDGASTIQNKSAARRCVL
jgi:hypothetical protein